jgi:glycosyltransferase involved in cell wall biosynthesis
MIVRDEAPIIARCLGSARHLIDSWVICDTGSTDGTDDLVSSLLADLPGALHRRPWRDFGSNRSELMKLALGAADYLLLLDADMTLSIERSVPTLGADAYLLRHAGELDYAVPRLVRGDRRWWYEGSTHEYLATEGPFTQELLPGVLVEHHGDGASRARKLERDRGLLEAELAREPRSQRATFYLAQTVRDLGEDERAVDLYKARAALAGWDEEVFYSLYQAGSLLAKRDPDGALAHLLEAWQFRPSRAEPLYELARISRFRGWHHAAYHFAARGLELPYPGDLLFVHRPVYEWGLLFEFAVAAYLIGELNAALEANDRLLAERRLPPEVEQAVRENRGYCVGAGARRRNPRTMPLARLAPSAELGEIQLDVSPEWPQFNPTIASSGEGFLLIVRTASYRLVNGGYELLTPGNAIETINYLVTLDAGLAVTDVVPLVDAAPGPKRYAASVRGYEDLRLVRLEECWLATATARDRNPGQICEIALLHIDDSEITSARILAGPADRHQKNWMPFVSSDRLYLLYMCDPTVVVRCDPVTGRLERVVGDPQAAELGALRGGSQGLRVDGGFLFAVHEALDFDQRRSYDHRLILLDDDFRVAARTPGFHFVSDGVEFCAGLARRGTDLLMTFGVEDRAAGIVVVEEDEVLGLLE